MSQNTHQNNRTDQCTHPREAFRFIRTGPEGHRHGRCLECGADCVEIPAQVIPADELESTDFEPMNTDTDDPDNP